MRGTAAKPKYHDKVKAAEDPLKSIRLENDFSKREGAESLVRDFSIVVGGPIYDFLKRTGVVRVELPNVLRRIAALVLITWLPLLVLSLQEGLAFGHNVAIPLLYDYATYARLLLALPLLLLAEVVIDPAIVAAVAEFVDAGLVQENEFPKFEQVVHQVRKLRDSKLPELTLLAFAFFPTFLFQHEWAQGTISSWHTNSRGVTLSGWWYIVISAPGSGS